MTRSRALRRVYRDRTGVWAALGYVWVFRCRYCSRRGHHATWQRSMAHADLHMCAPGSFW